MHAEKALNGWKESIGIVQEQKRLWKQAVGIIEEQQRALEWCISEIERFHDEGHIEPDEQKAKEFYEIVHRAIGVSGAYIKAMRQSGALET